MGGSIGWLLWLEPRTFAPKVALKAGLIINNQLLLIIQVLDEQRRRSAGMCEAVESTPLFLFNDFVWMVMMVITSDLHL